MVAVVDTGVQATDSIPLLDDNGSGVYNKGRNNLRDFRMQLLGGLVGKVNQPFAYRSGIITPSLEVGGALVDGLVSSTGGAGTQAVNLNMFRAVITRTGQGPQLVSQETNVTNIPAPAADGSNPRRDVLAIMPYDKGALPGDALHGPRYIWITGDPAPSPTTPALPAAVADALPLGLVIRAANDNTIASGDCFDMRVGASLHGTPRILLPAELLSTIGNYHGEIRQLIGSFVPAAIIARGTTMLWDYWDDNVNQWKPMSRPSFAGNVIPPGTGFLGTSEGMFDTVTIDAIAGHKYKIEYGGGVSMNTSSGALISNVRYAAGASVTTGGTLIRTNAISRISPDECQFHIFRTWDAPTTGQYTIGVGSSVGAGASSGSLWGISHGNSRELLITDMDA